jgi:hypothetical protein
LAGGNVLESLQQDQVDRMFGFQQGLIVDGGTGSRETEEGSKFREISSLPFCFSQRLQLIFQLLDLDSHFAGSFFHEYHRRPCNTVTGLQRVHVKARFVQESQAATTGIEIAGAAAVVAMHGCGEGGDGLETDPVVGEWRDGGVPGRGEGGVVAEEVAPQDDALGRAGDEKYLRILFVVEGVGELVDVGVDVSPNRDRARRKREFHPFAIRVA